jgi:superoxide dismutase, Fe-Mn family
MEQKYVLPNLGYGYADLSPFLTEEQLKLHHQKHHQAYVNGANALFDKLEKARKEGLDLDMKATLKELSFHVGGHILHSLFWGNMAPPVIGGGGKPEGKLFEAISSQFGSFERFKKEFTQAATSTEGSGWAALAYDKASERLVLMQIEKHNVNVHPNCKILLVLDVWEHAYYLDYKNDRAKFVEGFFSVINWKEAGKRFSEL